MSTLAITLLAILCVTYGVGFVYCLTFEYRLRSTLRRTKAQMKPPKDTLTLEHLLGVCIVPLVIGGIFTFRWNTQKRWEIEISLIKASLDTSISDGRISWHSAVNAHSNYIDQYLPTPMTP